MLNNQEFNEIKNQELLQKGIAEAKISGNYDNEYLKLFINKNEALVNFYIKKNYETLIKLKNFYSIEDFKAIFMAELFRAMIKYKTNMGASFGTFAFFLMNNKLRMIIRNAKGLKNKIHFSQTYLEEKVQKNSDITLEDVLIDERNLSVEDLCIQTYSNLQLIKRLKLVLTSREYKFIINQMNDLKSKDIAKLLGTSKATISKIKTKLIDIFKLWKNLARFSFNKKNWQLLTKKIYPQINRSTLYKEWLNAQLIIKGKLNISFFYNRLSDKDIDMIYRKYINQIFNILDNNDTLKKAKLLKILPSKQAELLSLKIFNKITKEEILRILDINNLQYKNIEIKLLQNLEKLTHFNKEDFEFNFTQKQ